MRSEHDGIGVDHREFEGTELDVEVADDVQAHEPLARYPLEAVALHGFPGSAFALESTCALE